MADLTVKSGNITASCEDSGIIFRTSNGTMIKFPYDDWEVLAAAVREKKYQKEKQERKNNPKPTEASY